jgi:hypothetical protein
MKEKKIRKKREKNRKSTTQAGKVDFQRTFGFSSLTFGEPLYGNPQKKLRKR